jgi:hypothetical protein
LGDEMVRRLEVKGEREKVKEKKREAGKLGS